MPVKKIEDALPRCDEGLGKLRIRSLPDDDQQRHLMFNDCRQFVGLVANAAIMGDGYPATCANLFKPDRVRAIVCEVVCMSLDPQTGGGKYFWKALSEIAVGEEDAIHAARS